jgi:hypothetical protein
LPGIPGSNSMFVRDMGPQENGAVRALHPDRAAMVALAVGDRVTLVDYRTGMQTRWGVQ